MSYQNYHKHSHISNIILADSVATNEDYCKRAVELDHTLISSCEHGTQGNYRETADLASKYGLKWRYVSEAYMVKDRLEKDRLNTHIILAAKTEKGIGDLNFALSEANISGYYYRPRVDMEILLSLDPKDVFITTACVGGIFRYGYEEAERLIARLSEHYRDSFMLEVQYHHTALQREVNEFLLTMYRKYGIPLIMGTDSHYIHPEDKVLRDQRLEANHIVYEHEEGWFMDYPSDEEAYNRFIAQGVLSPVQIREAMDNTNIFISFDDVILDKSKKLPTIYPDLSQSERNEMYRKLVYEKWDEFKKNIPEEKWPEYIKGLNYEVETITSTDTSDYFLLNYEIVKKGKEKGGLFTYTGRGSGPSFFTNTLLGFSYMDRFSLPVTMYPDRFISADRLESGSMPDIDMNCGVVEPFIDAQTEVVGDWKCAPMVKFGTLQRSGAWKMYCRANNVEFEVANKMSERIKQYELDFKHADDDEKDDIDVFSYVPQDLHEHLRMSEKYLDMIDSIGPNNASFVLCKTDVRREFGLFRILSGSAGKKKPVLTAFVNGTTADGYGYLKNDILKVDVVKINTEVYKRIGMPQPTVNELLNMTKDDTVTWGMYAKGYTMGLNQAEKEKSTEKIMRYKPQNISELAAFVAGIRPSFQSMVNLLLDRKKFEYGIPALDKLLQTPEMPSSFVLYQEQMMKVLQYGSFSAPESCAAIKAISKKQPEKIMLLKERFLEGFAQRLIDEENIGKQIAKDTAEKVWEIISDARNYSFNSCLSGTERLYRSLGGKSGFLPTIEEMYRIRHDKEYAKLTNHASLHDKYKREGYGYALSLYPNGRIKQNRIVDIYDSGMADTYKVTMSSGATILCTANHKFPTPNGDKKLEELNVGDTLYLNGGYEKCNIKYTFSNGICELNYPKKGQSGFQKNKSGPSVLFFKKRNTLIEKQSPSKNCGTAYDANARFELHHIDNDRTNNNANNLLWCCVSCHKKEHYKNGRTKRFEKGHLVTTDSISSIVFHKRERVYDIEMDDPAHNFVVESGIVTSNSHAIAVALDSLYGAYAKAHYPYEYYTTLLQNYSLKGDKTRISKAKVEMKKAFGIKVVPCKFRQDNRDYFIDKENGTISDALTSVKHISQKVANALYSMRSNAYQTFTDLAYDLEMHSAFTSQNITILIKMGYFQEFGSTGKLLRVYDEFRNGSSKFSKTHIHTTQQKRLAALREIEQTIPESDLSIEELMDFEVEHYGSPMTEDPTKKGYYTALEIDDRYSPKIKLYNIATGGTGVMKVKKAQYLNSPIKEGNVIHLKDWIKKPAYQYIDGKSQVKPGVYDLWILDYKISS